MTAYLITITFDLFLLPKEVMNDPKTVVFQSFRRFGFKLVDGIFYGTDPVSCVLAVQQATKDIPWFAGAVININLLRVEEITDLKRILQNTP